MGNLEERLMKHHLAVQAHIPVGYEVIFTSLIGSQNYGFASENSDIDTYSIIFPNLTDYVIGTEPYSKEFDMEDGKCVVRDARLTFHSLRKSNPNSLEVFTTPYKVYNKKYEEIVKLWLREDTLKALLHANWKQMVNAIAGTAHGLHGRNMTAAKKYSHCLRLQSMLEVYLDLNRSTIFYLLPPQEIIEKARAAKFGVQDEEHSKLYTDLAKNISMSLDNFAKNFKETDGMKVYSKEANMLITNFMMELFQKYMEDYEYGN
jgi:predicted nucleotidyltransferase